MSSQDFVKLALQLATMLGFAVMFGEMMRRLNQPAVVGEMFGGIILGPTILGSLVPSLYHWLFLSSANVNVVRDASTKLGMLLFLFYAGLEVNLSDLKTVGKKAILIGRGVGHRLRPQRARRNGDYPRRSRAGEWRNRCAHFCGADHDSPGHLFHGRPDDEPFALAPPDSTLGSAAICVICG